MESLSAFWRKDRINKLIVIISGILIAGVIALVIVLIRMPDDKSVKGAVYEYVPAANPTLNAQKALTNEVATLQAIPTETFTPKPPTITSLPSQTIGPSETSAPIGPSATPTVTSTPTAVPTTATPLPTSTGPASTQSTAATPTAGSAMFACIPPGPAQTGRAVDIIDGNTIRVLMDDGLVYTVRYIGIVPPENVHYEKMATFENSELVYGKEIQLTSGEADKDSRGRLLRYVTAGQTFVNLELLRLGLATVSEEDARIPCMAEFKLAQQEARNAGSGLWSLPQFTATP